MANNYWSSFALSQPMDGGAKTLSQASDTLDSLFKNTTQAFTDGKQAINDFTSLFSQDSDLYKVFQRIDDSNKIKAQNEAEQIARSNEDLNMQQEVFNTLNSIKNDVNVKLTEKDSLDTVGASMETLENAYRHMIESKLTNDGIKMDGRKLSTDQVISLFENPTLLKQAMDEGRIDQSAANSINDLFKNDNFNKVMTTRNSLKMRQMARDKGLYTDSEAKDVSQIFYNMIGNGYQNRTQEQIRNDYITQPSEMAALIKNNQNIDLMTIFGSKKLKLDKDGNLIEDEETQQQPKPSSEQSNDIKSNRNTTYKSTSVKGNPQQNSQPINNESSNESTNNINDANTQINDNSGEFLLDKYDSLESLDTSYTDEENQEIINRNLEKLKPEYREQYLAYANYQLGLGEGLTSKDEKELNNLERELTNELAKMNIPIGFLASDKTERRVLGETKFARLTELRKQRTDILEKKKKADEFGKFIQTHKSNLHISNNSNKVASQVTASLQTIKDKEDKIENLKKEQEQLDTGDKRNTEIQKEISDLEKELNLAKEGHVSVVDNLVGSVIGSSDITQGNERELASGMILTVADVGKGKTKVLHGSPLKSNIRLNNAEQAFVIAGLSKGLKKGLQFDKMIGLGQNDKGETTLIASPEIVTMSNKISEAFNYAEQKVKDKYKNDPSKIGSTAYWAEVEKEAYSSGFVFDTAHDKLSKTFVEISDKLANNPNLRTSDGGHFGSAQFANIINEVFKQIFKYRQEVSKSKGNITPETATKLLLLSERKYKKKNNKD